MKVFYLFAVLFLSIGCSHHHKESAHHHHDPAQASAKQEGQVAFDGKCAYAIIEGDAHVHGKEEFKLEHGGTTYFFSSKENLEKFKKDVDANVSKANSRFRSLRR